MDNFNQDLPKQCTCMICKGEVEEERYKLRRRISQDNIIELKGMRENVKWEIEEERRKFRDRLYRLIRKWEEGPFPRLRDIFRREEIDWLLTVEVKNKNPGPFTLFAIKTGYKDEPELDKDGKPLLSRVTPVHRAAILKNRKCVKELFKIFANCDANYADECGSTHFHVACQYGCEDVVEKFLEHGQDPNCGAPLGGEPPLLLAARDEDEAVVKLLLQYGADPNVRNSSGSTALHIICKSYGDGIGLFDMLFELSDEKYHPVQIDAQNQSGQTPMHFAQLYGNAEMSAMLLGIDVNPNIADKEGLTPLHFLCKGSIGDENKVEELLVMLFELSNIKYQPININAQDKLGHTSLHYALVSRNEILVQLLLSVGANPNLAKKDGSTALHVIFNDYRDDKEWALMLFQSSDQRYHPLQVNARDKLGRTPLQLAVAHLFLNEVDVLLDLGADLSNFVFPDIIVSQYYKRGGYELEFSSSVLVIAESLEKRGYAFDRNDVLKIMKFFAEWKLFADSMDLEKSRYNDTEFVTKAEKIMVIPSLSLYDLMQLRPEEAAKQITCRDYFKLAASRKLSELYERYKKACSLYLCEMMLRGFFRSWALDCFYEITHYRLPILCCDMVIDELTNQDLCNICLATTI